MPAFVPWAIVFAALAFLVHRSLKMSQALDDLAAAVAEETSVDESIIALIEGLVTQIEQASPDPRIQELTAQIRANTASLAAKVTVEHAGGPSGRSGTGRRHRRRHAA